MSEQIIPDQDVQTLWNEAFHRAQVDLGCDAETALLQFAGRTLDITIEGTNGSRYRFIPYVPQFIEEGVIYALIIPVGTAGE
jgi:hypothetical protein